MLNSELDVINFWRDNDTFQKSLDQNKNGDRYIFLDGPPFVTGLPTFGHISTGYPKDTFPRYWTQKGKYAMRRWGWDCHGLPIENMVQKQLKIRDKREIENKIGIDKFNEACRQNIISFDSSWRDYVERSGRWVDMDDQYRTMDSDFIESVWWGLGRIWDQNLLYKDYRSSMYSPTMGVSLSHMEIADDISYQNDTVDSVVAKFKIQEGSRTKLINKILEEILFNISEQKRYQLDVQKRIEVLEKLDPTARKLKLQELIQRDPKAFSELNWDDLESGLDAGEELKHLQQQFQIILENLDVLKNLQKILESKYAINLLVWTTTPWTLPANTAIAVNQDLEYSMYFLESTSELVILSEDRAKEILSLKVAESILKSDTGLKAKEIKDADEYFSTLDVGIKKVVGLTGLDLQGISYQPLFETAIEIESDEQRDNIHKVYLSEFVNSEEGTGLLHVAPSYGPEDYEIGQQYNLPLLYTLNEYGEVMDNLSPVLAPAFGKFFTTANGIINDILKDEDLLFDTIRYTHKYPIYNRDNKPVYYVAQENWYIGETKVLSHSLKLNQEINWKPNHLKDGRFSKGLESAPNWCISRKRYWGTPLPIWQNSDKTKTIFVDSYAKLIKYALNPIKTLINSDELNQSWYDSGKSVIVADSNSKLPLGISATQYRSKALTDIRREKDLTLQKFAYQAQKILDEIIELFEKYDTVHLAFSPEEQRMWTTWLLTLHPESKKVSQKFYFYQRLEKDEFGDYTPKGGVQLLDLHRPFIDDIILKDKDEVIFTRLPDVVDGWVDSGSMPWASWHYPFENKELVESQIPADYIVEYEGQIRGWFHALHVLSTIIFDKPAFSNVHVHGTILGNDGKKLSKSKKNFDSTPDELMKKVGSDAIRLYFFTGAFFNGEPLAMKDRDVIDIFKVSTLMLANSGRFIRYVLDDYGRSQAPKKYRHPLNRWWQARTKAYIQEIDKYMEEYNLIEASRLITPYIKDFSTWYIRRAKNLLEEHGPEVADCIQSTVKQFAIYTASLQPFNTERLWSIIKTAEDPESVHLTKIENTPQIDETDKILLTKMDSLRELVSSIHSIRKEKQIRVRQPLYADFSQLKVESGLLELLKVECNLLDKDLANTEGQLYESQTPFGYLKVDLVVDKELSILGFTRDFERSVQGFRKEQGFKPGQIVKMKWQTVSVQDDEILQRVLKELDWDKLSVEIEWVKDLDQSLDKSFQVKDLVKIVVDD